MTPANPILLLRRTSGFSSSLLSEAPRTDHRLQMGPDQCGALAGSSFFWGLAYPSVIAAVLLLPQLLIHLKLTVN